MGSGFILKSTLKDLERSRDIGRVCEALEALPHDKAWRIEIEQAKSERSLSQNRYLFGVAYPLLSEATGYEAADLHEYLLGSHFGWKLKRIPRTKRNPEGLVEVPVRTTTTDAEGRRSVLGKVEFSDFVSFVQRMGVRAGVIIPDPDEQERAAA